MALDLPESAAEIDQRSKVDVQRALPTSNPFLRNSWLGSIITATANRIFDFYFALTDASKEAIMDTAVVLLPRHAAIYGRIRNAAIGSSGRIAATGTATTIVPISTTYASSDGLVYTSTAAATITAQTPTVDLEFSAGTVTATTASDHLLGSNVEVVISGATPETDYNGTFAVLVTSATTFTYTITGTPGGDDTGVASFTTGSVPVLSVEEGADTAQDLDATLTLQSPISGVDNAASVDFGQLSGGTDQESDAGLRTRLLERVQNPTAHFNDSDIISQAKTVPGVTRVFVFDNIDETGAASIGEISIYFMRDDDATAIPSGAQATVVWEALLPIIPANTDPGDTAEDGDVHVLPPEATPGGGGTTYVFTALEPDTASMQAAIIANLEQFYSERVVVGEDVLLEAYTSAIYNTVDTTNGDVVVSFALSGPTIDIPVSFGEIAVFATATFT